MLDTNNICNTHNDKREVVLDDKAIKELKKIPEKVRNAFLTALQAMQNGDLPTLEWEYLSSVGQGVVELKINGKPAYRCVIYNKISGKIVVLHVTDKKTNGQCQSLIRKSRTRLQNYI